MNYLNYTDAEFVEMITAPGNRMDRFEVLGDHAGYMQPEAVAECITHLWQMAEAPEWQCGRSYWEMMFSNTTLSGVWVTDGPERPAEPVRLYRAGSPDGMAWTGSLEVAQWFVKYRKDRFGVDSKIYTTIADPKYVDPMQADYSDFFALLESQQILARFSGRDEDEYVLAYVHDAELVDAA